MLASSVLIACYAAHFGSPPETNPFGVWVADIGPKPSDITKALWSGGRLRLRPDGSFDIYAPIAAEGRYTRSGAQLHLVFSKVLGRETAFWNDKISEQPLLKGMSIIEPLDITIGDAGLANSSAYPLFAGVRWTRWKGEPIAECFPAATAGKQSYDRSSTPVKLGNELEPPGSETPGDRIQPICEPPFMSPAA